MTIPVITQVVASMASIMGVDMSVPMPSNHSSPLRIGNGGAHAASAEVEYHHPGPVPVRYLPSWLNLAPELASGIEGSSRLRRLAFNSYYLHRGLDKLGFITYGHPSSPIVPLLLFHPAKLLMFHRMMKDRQTPIITVVVAYPATPLITGRVRFCVSASHTKEDIDTILRACDEIGDVMDLKHGLPRAKRWTIEQITSRAVELVKMKQEDLEDA
jgi:serine palmitoyltransferase